MKRSLMGLALALALAAPMSAAAAPSAQVERQVETLLRAPEYVPSAEDWKKVGPDAAEVLQRIARDNKSLLLRRARAAAALAHFKSDASRAVLAELVADAKAPWLLRGKAARTLAVSYQADSLPLIAPLLQHDKKRLREQAIKAVGLIQADASRTLLNSRLGDEKDEYLRSVIRATLERLAKGGSR